MDLVAVANLHFVPAHQFLGFSLGMITASQERIIFSGIHQKNTSGGISLQNLLILLHHHLWGWCLKL